jgi:hypothetical protein
VAYRGGDLTIGRLHLRVVSEGDPAPAGLRGWMSTLSDAGIVTFS